MPRIANVKDEDMIKSQKGVYILGKDIREVPCLRSSLLLGITCGTFVGLLSFMTTSKALLSCHIGFASIWVVAFGYWIPCRYDYETKTAIKMHEYEKILAARIEETNDTSSITNEEEKK